MHPRSPGLLLLLLVLTTTSKTTTVHAFSPATTRQQHQIIVQASPHYSNSGLNLFGRTKVQAENGDDDNEGGNTNHQRGGVLRNEVKKLDSFPARAKQLRGYRTKNEDRHAWKKKPGAERKNLPIVIERALYHWRGLTQKLRYAVNRNTIYVLECEGGKYYVGSTRNRKQRYREHFESYRRRGSKWTRLHRPLRVIAEYKRIPSRYLMGMESQKTSELMVKHGVNNVRGAGYCLVKEFTTDDLPGLTTFLGHYNQLNYDSLGQELAKVLPRPPPSKGLAFTPPKDNRKKKSRSPNDTKLTDKKDVAIMTDSFNRKFRNDKTQKRKKQRKRSKERGRIKCYNCGGFGHLASECPNEGTNTDIDASFSSTFNNRWESDAFNNRWESDAVATSDGSMDTTESISFEVPPLDPSFHPDSLPSSNTSSSAPAFIPSDDLNATADGENPSESYAISAKEKDEKLPTGQAVANMDLSAEECSQILLNACSTTRKIQLNEWQHGQPWIMAILMHRYDRGIRDLDELNRDSSYYYNNNSEKNNTKAAISMRVTPEGYIDLRQALTPLPNEVDVFIRSMNKRSLTRNDTDSDSNDENDNPVFDFTIKGQNRAREALQNEKMALLAIEARRILLDPEIPLLKFAPELGSETEAHMLSEHDPTVFLSRFSRAFALYEQTKMKDC